MEVVIVGAGTFGASLAWLLAREGEDVTLVDQFEPGDTRASSGGETRLMRCSHGANAEYTASARRARTLWRELEAESGEALYEECGMAWFAHGEDGWEASSERTLTSLEIPCERVNAADLYPSVAPTAFTLFEPEAGVLRAQRAVRALATQVAAHGGRQQVDLELHGEHAGLGLEQREAGVAAGRVRDRRDHPGVEEAVLLGELGPEGERDLDPPRLDALHRRAEVGHDPLAREARARALLEVGIRGPQLPLPPSVATSGSGKPLKLLA